MNLLQFRKLTTGFTRGHCFNLTIFDGIDQKKAEWVQSLCSSMHLPTKTIDVHELRMQSGTPALKIAKGASYSPWKLSFYADDTLAIRKLFLQWMELISNSSNQSFATPNKYKRDSAQATVLSPTFSPIHTYSFYGLYPINVSEIVLQQRDTDVMVFDVELAFDFFRVNEATAMSIAKGQEAPPINSEEGQLRTIQQIEAERAMKLASIGTAFGGGNRGQ